VHGPLPIDDALAVARQIADGLEAAHDQGMVHRDLKPANIKLRPDGTVKVLDFGLAKLTAFDDVTGSAAGPHPHVSHSPTITSPAMMTRVGVILGTAAYMSPEQARGRAVDKRADIWAFGCVLFEMISGRRAFDGDDVTETLAAVVKSEPPWGTLPPATPPSVRRLLERCLRKDPARRLRDIADAKLDIEEALSESAAPVSTDTPQHRSARTRERWLWASALCITIVALAVMALAYRRASSIDASEIRLQIVTPPGQMVDFAISPDGKRVVFAALTGGATELWIRPLSASSAQRLPGTAGGISVLVAQQPGDRLLRRSEAETDRDRERHGADAGRCTGGSRRCLGRRYDRFRAREYLTADAHSGARRSSGRGDTPRNGSSVASRTGIPAGRPSLPVPGDRTSGCAGRLSGVTRLDRVQAAVRRRLRSGARRTGPRPVPPRVCVDRAARES